MELSMHVTNVITNAYLRRISKSTYRQNIKTNLEMVPIHKPKAAIPFVCHTSSSIVKMKRQNQTSKSSIKIKHQNQASKSSIKSIWCPTPSYHYAIVIFCLTHPPFFK